MFVLFDKAEAYIRGADAGLWLALLITGGALLARRRRASWPDTRAVTVAALAFVAVAAGHFVHTVAFGVLNALHPAYLSDDMSSLFLNPDELEHRHRLEAAHRASAWAVRGLDAAAVLAVAWAVAAGRRPGHSPPGA